MPAEHIELLVEEPSMELFLLGMLPRLLAGRATFNIHSHQGKTDLLAKLGSRLKAYAKWIPETYRIFVLVDRDSSNCLELKALLEKQAELANLVSRSKAAQWNFVSRIAIEELEAWYFGDWKSVTSIYPKITKNIPTQANYRVPDAISGGTWEAFERILQRNHYFPQGLRKLEVAREIGQHLDWENCSSQSFKVFKDAVIEAIS